MLISVVYLLIPTSNHNCGLRPPPGAIGCISFDSYIKPQQKENRIKPKDVVYLLIPTSNHNVKNEKMK